MASANPAAATGIFCCWPATWPPLPGCGQPDAEPTELDTALDRVSREGSGDDVSVAIGRVLA
jgi:hypothetical protein